MRRTFASIAEFSKPKPWAPASEAHRRLGELQTIRAGIIAGLTEWKNRKNSGMIDAVAQSLADVTISHFTSQLGAVDEAITLTIDNDPVLRRKRDLLLSISGVGETLAGVVLAELPGPDVLRSSAEVVAYAGLNPRLHESGTSIDRMTRISKIGNAVLRAALYMPAMSAMRYDPAIAALVARLKSRGRLKPKQIVVAAMRKLLVLCFGVLNKDRSGDSDGLLSYIDASIAWRAGWGQRRGSSSAARRGARQRAGLTPGLPPTHFHAGGNTAPKTTPIKKSH